MSGCGPALKPGGPTRAIPKNWACACLSSKPGRLARWTSPLVGPARDEGNWYEIPRESPRPPAGEVARREEILGGTEDRQKEGRNEWRGEEDWPVLDYVSAAMDLWAYTNGVILDFSRRGKPTDNGAIESKNV